MSKITRSGVVISDRASGTSAARGRTPAAPSNNSARESKASRLSKSGLRRLELFPGARRPPSLPFGNQQQKRPGDGLVIQPGCALGVGEAPDRRREFAERRGMPYSARTATRPARAADGGIDRRARWYRRTCRTAWTIHDAIPLSCQTCSGLPTVEVDGVDSQDRLGESAQRHGPLRPADGQRRRHSGRASASEGEADRHAIMRWRWGCGRPAGTKRGCWRRSSASRSG